MNKKSNILIKYIECKNGTGIPGNLLYIHYTKLTHTLPHILASAEETKLK